MQETAARLAEGCATPREKVERFVLFVRDEILFGFPPDFDWTPASETLRLLGGVDAKGTLMLALCKAAGIPARMHFAPIRKSIQRGLFTGPGYWLMPQHLARVAGGRDRRGLEASRRVYQRRRLLPGGRARKSAPRLAGGVLSIRRLHRV